jgi:integrase
MAKIPEKELPAFLRKLEKYDTEYRGALLTKLAFKLMILTFVRSGEIRGAKWEEINFDKAEWRIPAERMKMKEQHIIPLSTQAIEVLREVQGHTGNREHVFPNQHHPRGSMSENTLLYALYRMGYHSRATAHGFRSTASTILEPVHNLLSMRATKASVAILRLVLIFRSQFFQSLRHFSSHANERSTTHRLGMTAKV